MRPLQFVRRNPLPVLAFFTIAFVAWVWRDALDSKPVSLRPKSGNRVSAPIEIRDPRAVLDDGLPEPPKMTAQVLPKLKPGMTRAEVEGLVGSPGVGNIFPATIAGGRVTYHTSYEADLGPPGTVRPLRHGKLGNRMTAPPTRSLVTLEFDATKPGHPLLGVHYPDPLF